MNRVEAVLRGAARDLAVLRPRFCLLGGLAVSARTEPRFTRDVDLAIAVPGDAGAEHAVRALRQRGYRVLALVEQEAVGRLATARLVPPGEDEAGIVVDVLFASSGIEAEISERADVLEVLPGLRLPVASVGHLLALKLLARDDRTRPQDRVDLSELLRVAGSADLDEARRAVALIHARGFQRGRDLLRGLDRFSSRWMPFTTSMIWCTGKEICGSGLGATSTGRLSESTSMGSCFVPGARRRNDAGPPDALSYNDRRPEPRACRTSRSPRNTRRSPSARGTCASGPCCPSSAPAASTGRSPATRCARSSS